VLFTGCGRYDTPLTPPKKAKIDQQLIGDWVSYTTEGQPGASKYHCFKDVDGTFVARLNPNSAEPVDYDLSTTKLGKYNYLNAIQQKHPDAKYNLFQYTVTSDHRLLLNEPKEEVLEHAVLHRNIVGYKDSNADWHITDNASNIKNWLKTLTDTDWKLYMELRKQ
jgi:hypothetical protein